MQPLHSEARAENTEKITDDQDDDPSVSIETEVKSSAEDSVDIINQNEETESEIALLRKEITNLKFENNKVKDDAEKEIANLTDELEYLRIEIRNLREKYE